MQRLKRLRVCVHDGGEARHRGDHEEEVTGERAKDGAKSGACAIARGRVQDRQRSRSGDELKNDDGGDEAAVVLNAEHGLISGSSP